MNKNPRLEARRKQIPEDVKIFIDNSFAIAEQIEIILNKKGLSQKDFSKLLGKEESEISKWMSGVHNFTQRTLAKIQFVLGEPITVCPKDFCPTEYRLYFTQDQSVIVTSNKKETTIIKDEESINMLFSISNKEEVSDCSHQKN